MILAGSVVLGSRVLAAADDTVQVWAVADDAVAGEQLDPDALVAQRVRFADEEDLERYLAVDDPLPDDLTLLRGLGAGELVPRAAIGAADDAGTVTISLAVAPQLVPSAVGPGAVVDVYVTGEAPLGPTGPNAQGPGASGAARDPGEPVLDDVAVVAAAAVDDGFGPSGERQVELAVPSDQVGEFYGLLGTLTTPVISLAQVR